MSTFNLNLFPLHTVLFPGGTLQLKVFEPRYLDMVGDCLKRNTGFGVCLIKQGGEVGQAPKIFDIGTIVSITDWDRTDDGILRIDIEGQGRFRSLTAQVHSNQLVESTVENLVEESSVPMQPAHDDLVDIVRSIIDRFAPMYKNMKEHYDEPTWVSFRLAELLPLPLLRKQYCLEMEDPILRLEYLHSVVHSIYEAHVDGSAVTKE